MVEVEVLLSAVVAGGGAGGTVGGSVGGSGCVEFTMFSAAVLDDDFGQGFHKPGNPINYIQYSRSKGNKKTDISNTTQVVFRIFDIFWCAAFLLELGLRIIADGSLFLNRKNPERLDSKLKTILNR